VALIVEMRDRLARRIEQEVARRNEQHRDFLGRAA